MPVLRQRRIRLPPKIGGQAGGDPDQFHQLKNCTDVFFDNLDECVVKSGSSFRRRRRTNPFRATADTIKSKFF
jgi:hypothetical protein